MRHGCPEASTARSANPWILAATILGSSMAFIDSTVVNVALPALQSSFHASIVDVQWVVESYGLFLAALILVGGALGDAFGRRIVFLAGIVIFASASAGCGLASSINGLILWRSFQGIGAAMLVPGSLAIISASFDEKSRGRAIGTWSGFTAITSAVGPVLGGWLIEHASWRWAFFINLPLAAAVVVITLWRVPESRSSSKASIDWLGALSVTIGLAGIVYALLESSSHGWTDPLVLGTLLVGAACIVLFLFIEQHASSPMVPLKLLRSPAFGGANLLTLLLYSALGIFFFLFPSNLIQVHRYSATASGAALLPLILLMFFFSRWSGGLVTRYGKRPPLIAGPIVVAIGFFLCFLPSIGGTYWKTYFPGVVVLGGGLAITVAPLTTTVMSSVNTNQVGTASGINNAVARLAGVLAIAVLGIVMVNAFAYRLERGMAELHVTEQTRAQIHSERVKLAAMPIPADMDAATGARLKVDLREAFLFAFRIIMLCCAFLALASSLIAAKFIRQDVSTPPLRE
jgi:EmrB/QacA subfamily drug resistance transporter